MPIPSVWSARKGRRYWTSIIRFVHQSRQNPQTDEHQATEVAIAANVLNRMLDLGRPEYVRIV